MCDAGGERPFATDKQLQQHVQSAHKRQLCPVCLGVRVPGPALSQLDRMYELHGCSVALMDRLQCQTCATNGQLADVCSKAGDSLCFFIVQWACR